MAAITRTTGAMTDGGVLTGTRILFQVFNADSAEVQALPPADPENPTVGERLFVRGFMPAVEVGTGAIDGGVIASEFVHVDAAATGLSGAQVTALKQALAILHATFKTAADL